jgi:hypothetical protein
MTSWCGGPTNASSRRWAPRWHRSPRWITLQGIDEQKMLSFRGKDPAKKVEMTVGLRCSMSFSRQ